MYYEAQYTVQNSFGILALQKLCAVFSTARNFIKWLFMSGNWTVL